MPTDERYDFPTQLQEDRDLCQYFSELVTDCNGRDWVMANPQRLPTLIQLEAAGLVSLARAEVRLDMSGRVKSGPILCSLTPRGLSAAATIRQYC